MGKVRNKEALWWNFTAMPLELGEVLTTIIGYLL